MREVMADGHNALFAPFFKSDAIAARVIKALVEPQRFASLRTAARQTILDRYGLADCLKRQQQLVLDTAEACGR